MPAAETDDADEPEGIVWSPSAEDYYAANGVLAVEIPRGTETADLSSLEEIPESAELYILVPPSLKILTLPAGSVSASAEPPAGESFSLDLLDASRAEGLARLSLWGEVKAALLPESLETVTAFGGDLSVFAACPVLSNFDILHPADLSPLETFPRLMFLSVSRSGDDGAWDFSPLLHKPLALLRLFGEITAEEAESLAGAYIETIQISDASIRDLSFLRALPDLTTLLLSVCSDQPGEILSGDPLGEDLLPLLNTPIPTEQLLELVRRGTTVYVFAETGR